IFILLGYFSFLSLPLSLSLQLVPLIGFISVGLGSAVLYLLRLALYSPDVSWDRKNNPEPWNKLSPTDQYKVSTGGTGGAGSVCGGDTATFRALFSARGKGDESWSRAPRSLCWNLGRGHCVRRPHPSLTSLPSPVSGNFH
uniref:NDUFA4 mitochondrial complex associated like 2 n=14 Tax=Neoaves TaxID=3078114 RepID=A0A803V1F6_FICAL